MSLPVTREARRRLFPGGGAGAGPVAFSRPREARELAERLAAAAGKEAALAVAAGELNAASQLEEIFQALITRYLERDNPDLFRRALARLEVRLGRARLDDLLGRFAALFDLAGEGGGAIPEGSRAAGGDDRERARLLRELLVFWLLDSNPALPEALRLLWRGAEELADLAPAMQTLAAFVAEEPAFGGGESGLIDTLRRPIEAAPAALADQLRLALELWGGELDGMRDQILGGLDLIAEETAPRFPPGPGPPPPARFEPPSEQEEERFSPDVDWMPRLVLMAKNVFVWLDQLSRRHGRPIRRLDEIPASELDTLAAQGFTGLWLIGLWQRSRASERIKKLCGNPEAAASAYALRDYVIADELGGEEALAALGAAARRRGIRLAADMVPNHMGIDSRWMLDHPERFLSVDVCPFPSYTFEGPDLSPRPDVGIYLEDHYYDRSDAAVVFKRVDRRTGEVRFVYHGNDGTSTPWNDTAQLDYLSPAVREAVIGTILRVAGRFPIIRFDAAMTLARKHIQRLWFPPPGTGGAIPSRAETGLSKEEFDRRIPEEFWRQVVDRIASEAPETLLLAEAFWLMESYFVRTLGMHRVYNSAFMNMLRDGRNADYHRLLRQTLDYDPRILRRYVNFMSNPDEDTAVNQFGKGDRYFGTCVLMATLPGLPMFAHGQIEGLAEKYGMEYRRSYREEAPDRRVVERHEREISPLLRRREVFAAVDRFTLLEVVEARGRRNDDVHAYANGAGGSRVVVVFNNGSSAVSGRLAVADRAGTGRGALGPALDLAPAAGRLLRFDDRISGVEYVVIGEEIEGGGLPIRLRPFEYRVLEAFRLVHDDAASSYSRLARRLDGRGAPSLTEALRDLELMPVRGALAKVLGADLFARLAAAAARTGAERPPAIVAELAEALREADAELAELLGEPAAPAALPRRAERLLTALLALPEIATEPFWPPTPRFAEATRFLAAGLERAPVWGALWSTAVLELERSIAGREPRALGAERVVAEALEQAAAGGPGGFEGAELVHRALDRRWLAPLPPPGRSQLGDWIEESRTTPGAGRLTGFNRAHGFEWWSGEALDALLQARFAFAAGGWMAADGVGEQERAEALAGWCDALARVRALARGRDYRLDRMAAALDRASATKSASE